MTFDILIQNGTVFDGNRKAGVLADLGITGDRIKALGKLSGAKGKIVIDATGQYVAPGFIDIQNHSDSYLTLLENPGLESLVAQGITTAVVGQCGSSLAPMASLEALKSVQKWRGLTGLNLNWLSFEEFLAAMRAFSLGLNIQSMVGHATLRRGLIHDEARVATAEEVAIMTRLLQQSLAAGAAGLSLGLVYSHEADASREELLALAKLTAQSDKLLSVHLRSEGAAILQSVEEVIDLARNSGARIKISHLKARGAKNFAFMPEVLARLERAYEQGVNIFFDVYPYTTSWSVLYTYLPKWAVIGGKKGVLRNIKDKVNRGRILEYLKAQETALPSIFIAACETNQSFVGKTLAAIAANQEVSAAEALLNVLEAAGTQVIVFDHNLSEDNLELMLRHPLSVVATDGAGYELFPKNPRRLLHPRCFGAYPKFLAMVREKKLMSWGEAIAKASGRVASHLKLPKRGTLIADNIADVVVFDPEHIASRATYENPYVVADGLNAVITGGTLSYTSDNGVGARAGKVL